MNRGARLSWLVPLGIAAVASLPFLPSLDGEFLHWDDDVNFVNNPHYRGLGGSNFRWMLSATLLGHYIPLTWLTLAVNHALGGMDPWGYHLGNLLLHAGNAVLLYLIARRLLAAAPSLSALRPPALALGAGVSALVFAVHPLRVESVAWITERRDVLCGFFYLLAVYAYLRGASATGPVWWRLASLAAFAAALLSKAMAMTLPATLLILDAYPLRRGSLGWKALLREKLPYAALAAAGAAIAVLAVDRGARWTPYEDYGAGARVVMATYTFWFHPSRFVWAQDLAPLYELPGRIDPLAARFLIPAVALAAMTAALALLRRRCPGALAAWVHSLIVLAPVSGIVHAGNQLAHDRYSYLSGLGFAVLAGAAVAWTRAGAAGRRPPWLAAAALGVAVLTIVGLGAAAWRQSHIWHDSTALWRAAVATDPACAICRNNLGAALMTASGSELESLREAEIHLRRAIALRPRFADAYRSLAALLVNQRRYEEAAATILDLMRALPNGADGPGRLAHEYEAQGRSADAIEVLRRAISLGMDSPATRAQLARMLHARGAGLAQAGQHAAAAALFAEAARLAPAAGEGNGRGEPVGRASWR